MKRSEMINKLIEVLKNKYCEHNFYTRPIKNAEIVELLLDAVEDLGMLPPEVKFKNFNFAGKGDILLNRWENEDE